MSDQRRSDAPMDQRRSDAPIDRRSDGPIGRSDGPTLDQRDDLPTIDQRRMNSDDPPTIDQRSKRVSAPPLNGERRTPLPPALDDRRSPLPRLLHNAPPVPRTPQPSQPPPPRSALPRALSALPGSVQPGPHGAIVPVPTHMVTRADTDAADEATTVEPPMFPMPEPAIDGLPPEVVYIPPPRPLALPISLMKRWGIVAAMVLGPLVIGIVAHECGSQKSPVAHGR
jgi:hypothetical protein